MHRNDQFEMSPEEQFNSILMLKNKIEDNFVELGQIFSQIKRRKLFKLRGYDNMRDFIEGEFNFQYSLAAKLINNYDLYIEEMDLADQTLKEIGFDKLNLIKPLVKNSSQIEQEEWLKKAEKTNTPDLKEEIKKIRELEKQNSKTFKQLFTEQYLEKMVTFFNCSVKELNFKLALFFQDTELEDVRKVIREKQFRFEQDIEKGKEPN